MYLGIHPPGMQALTWRRFEKSINGLSWNYQSYSYVGPFEVIARVLPTPFFLSLLPL